MLKRKKISSVTRNAVTVCLLLAPTTFFSSCGDIKPEPVSLNRDQCQYCKMTISDPRYASEGITSKRKIYKFDDVACMKNFIEENSTVHFTRTFVASFMSPHDLILVDSLKFVHGNPFTSPMGGNVAAFVDSQSALPYISNSSATWISWDQIVIHDEI